MPNTSYNDLQDNMCLSNMYRSRTGHTRPQDYFECCITNYRTHRVQVHSQKECFQGSHKSRIGSVPAMWHSEHATTFLQELKLESCEEFTKHSVQQFIALNELRTLSVRNCYMKSEVMTELLAALPKQLTALDVFGNCFSAPVATELEKQIRLRRLSVGARHECWKCFATEACNALVRVVRTLKDLWEFQVDTDCMETVSASRKLEMELKCALQRKPHIRSTLMRLDVRTLTHTKRRRLKPF